MESREVYQQGHLTARPQTNFTATEVLPGLHKLNLDGNRDGFYYVPKQYDGSKALPLALMLHGAGGTAEHGLDLLRDYADTHNIILLSPASRASTWDIIAEDGFGKDVIFIDQALALVFRNCNIDSSKIAIGGFSDGASYAICVGISNGDLFSHIIAFSPGFAYAVRPQGSPNIFVSHGTKDRILPIDPCSRKLVPRLQKMEYEVEYIEFEGEHIIPAEISKRAIDWFLLYS